MKIIKDFDLLSPKWLEIIFEKKNKQYGAYELRNDSSNRHLKALVIVFVVGLLTVFLPKIVATMKFGEKGVVETTIVDMSNMTKEDVPEDTPPPVDVAPPPPPELKTTVQFTEAVIKKDDEVNQENLQKAQDELAKIDAAIGRETVEGNPEGKVIIDDTPPPVVVDVPEIFTIVDKKAEFPGGEKELMRWLNENINYPIAAQEIGAQGRIYVNFIVRSDGRIDGIKVVTKDANPYLAREAERLVKDMPRWKPAEKNGNNVHSYFTLPITFILK